MHRLLDKSINLFLAALVLLVLFVSTAQAKASLGSVVTPSSAGFNIKFAKNGTPLAVPSNGAGGVVVATPTTINLSPLITAQVAASAIITGAQIAGPWGAAAAGLGVVAVFAIPAFADAYARAKMRVNPTTGALERADPNVCSVAPCFEYSNPNWAGMVGKWFSSRSAACAASSAYSVSTGGYSFSLNANDACQASVGGGVVSLTSRSIAPSPDAYGPVSLSEAQAAMSAQVPTVAQVDALADLGFQPETGPVTITGPAEVPGMNTVKVLADGSERTEACKYFLEYFPSNIKAHPECTATTVTPAKTETRTVTEIGPDGVPITKTVTTTTPGKTTTEVTTPDKLPDPVTCGLPGGSPCKIDETGTPPPVADTQFSSKLDTLKADQDTHVAKVGGTADKPFFSGWSSLFITPPLAACAVYELPSRNGVSMGSLDPCPVVEGVRSVMAYLWALGGFWLCLGWIRAVI
jgi:hypothetical protein